MTLRSTVIVWGATVAMAAGAALAQFTRPAPAAKPAQSFAAAIPERFGDWRVDASVAPVAPTPDVQQQLDQIYDEILSRTYVDASGQRVMLVIAYGGDQSDGLKAHRQEVCYAAQGFLIHEVRTDRVTLGEHTLPVVRVRSQNDARHEPISYWFMMGGEVSLSRADRLVAQVSHGLRGRIPDGLLLRVSTLGKDASAGFALQDRFLSQLLSSVDAGTRIRLAGALPHEP